jgi:hypothetical protein
MTTSKRSFLALALVALFAGSFAFAEAKSEKPAKAPCGCAIKKDGKVCGVDSDCCCTGEKAKGHATAAAATEKKADAAPKAGCTDAKCAEMKCDEKKGDKGCACTGCK